MTEFVKGEILEGENAYHCEQCDKKVKALRRVCLKSLPPVLILTLKRFEFDYQSMEKFKLNTLCSFPESVNFFEYTHEGLLESCEAYDKEPFEYILKGIIIHYGISEAGHYTSCVRTNSEEWQYFDDEKYENFDIKDLAKECFGGKEENPFGEDEDKKKNAYLLFYERKQLKNVAAQKTAINPAMNQIVEEENVKNMHIRMLFQENLQRYLFSLAESDPKPFLLYFHLVFLRNSAKKENLPEYFCKCERMLAASKDIANWYLSQIGEAFVMEFVIYADFEVRYLVTHLVKIAFVCS